jgi:hypothetical protein
VVVDADVRRVIMRAMQATDTLDKRTAARLNAHLSAHGARASSAHFGLHHSAIRKAAEGRAVSVRTLSVINAKLKTEDDYKLPKTVAIATQRKKPSVSWPLDAVRSARDAQLAGDFAKAAPLGTAMRLDDAIFTAHYNRTAPIGSLNLAVDSAGTTRGDAIAKKAKDMVTVDRSVLLSLESTLVLHGVAFGHVEAETLADGEEIAMTIKEWPIEFVKWEEPLGCYTTSAEGQSERVQIVHGDGEWIVFAKQDTLPHQHEACILPGALIFAAHLDAVRAWNASSTSHGQAKLIGELPEGVPLQDPDQDTLSPEASAFLAMLSDVISGESGAGIRPAGSKTDFVANGSSAWQVFSELAMNREKAAARVWLGNDGVLGSVGGAPGVDIATLFGVATTKVQGDVDAIEKGLYEGLYVPWTAVNFGEARLAPRLRFEIPDADAAQKNEQKQAARAAFFEALDLLKKNNMVVDQDVVDALAEEYGIDAPQLSDVVTVGAIEVPEDRLADIIRVSEARASRGLPPFGDGRDEMTLSEYETFLGEQREAKKVKAESDAAARQAAAEAQAQNVGSNPGVSPTSEPVDPAPSPEGQA